MLAVKDVGEREMRVKFKAIKPFKQKNSQIYEAPYRIYVVNLAWRVKPEDLKSHFSKFGTVNSAKVLNDRKDGKNRCYGFLSFSSPAESKAAASLSGTVEYICSPHCTSFLFSVESVHMSTSLIDSLACRSFWVGQC